MAIETEIFFNVHTLSFLFCGLLHSLYLMFKLRSWFWNNAENGRLWSGHFWNFRFFFLRYSWTLHRGLFFIFFCGALWYLRVSSWSSVNYLAFLHNSTLRNLPISTIIMFSMLVYKQLFAVVENISNFAAGDWLLCWNWFIVSIGAI